MGEVSVRDATLDDVALLRAWDQEPHVQAASDDDWAWETELARQPDWREQLIAQEDGRPFGFVQIIDPAREDTHYWGACAPNLRAIDIWIGPSDALGRGLGARLMRLVMARCFAEPAVTAILVDPLDSNARAHPFYERLGFVHILTRHFGEDLCRVYRLDRADWEQSSAN